MRCSSNSDLPLVSVLTPVYNGERYLVECIESVRAQTYPNWEYLLVNNCSTDGTLDIIRPYVSKDPRIKFHTNDRFVGLIENHNIAFSLASRDSKYCKVVSADDYLYPDSISQLVNLAERNPKVSIVGSYSISDNGVDSLGMPLDAVFSGRDICRLYLLGALRAFGTPSAVLYRSELVRSNVPFLPGTAPSADLAACFVYLQNHDYGFVHQILSYQRIHAEAASHSIQNLNGFLLDQIDFLADYGSIFLTQTELKSRQAVLLENYYEFLAGAVVSRRGKDFWHFHKSRISRLGYSLYSDRMAIALVHKLTDLMFNPKQTAQKAIGRFRSKSDASGLPRI